MSFLNCNPVQKMIYVYHVIIKKCMTTNAVKSDMDIFLRGELHGEKKRDYSKKDLDSIWEKVRIGHDWKERFETDADSVMKEIRRRRCQIPRL
jgi:hypothetical protein